MYGLSILLIPKDISFEQEKLQTMAENTEQQLNTEQVAQAITETDNPFAQHSEPVSTEFVTESLFGAPTEETQVVATEGQPPVVAATQPTAEEEEENEDPVSWLNEQWRDQGVKINTLDDIPSIIKDYHKLLANKPADLSKEEQARIKLGRETGDWTLYDQIVSIDTSKIENTEAMKTKFFLENPKMPRLVAEQLFERNLRKSINPDEDSEEFIKHYLEYEGAQAKQWLEEKKASINTAEDSKVEEVKQDDSIWFKGVDTVINQLAQDKNQITYELEDKAVNVVIDQEELLELRDAMDNPQGWIRDNILNEQGGWDFEKLAQLILKDMHINKIGKEYYELGRVHQEQHLLSKQRGTTTQQTATGAPKNNTDLRDNVAGVFRQFKTGF